jgi:hypothetical protein
MTLDLDELERLASAATPGPWAASWDFKRLHRDPQDTTLVAQGVGPQHIGKSDARLVGEKLYSPDEALSAKMMADAEYIAGLNPATATELITALRASQAENARLREALEVKGKADIYRDGFDAAVAVAESVKTHVSWGPAATPNDGLEEGMKAIRSSLQRARAAITAALAQGPET